MKNRLRIIGIIISIAVVFVSGGSDGRTNGSGPVVSTIATGNATSGSTDGTGTDARFSFSAGITTDGTNLFITDTFNHTVRKVVISTAAITTLAGTAGISGSADGIGSAARFNTPQGITTDGENLYVADTNNYTIRKITISTGEVSTLAGTAGLLGNIDGTGPDARFGCPSSITTEGNSLYVADTWYSTIRKIVIATGAVTTLAGKAGESGSSDGTETSARFNYSIGITTDGSNLYIADYGSSVIRRIIIATGEVSTLAGTAGILGSTDGTGRIGLLNHPQGIASDGFNLYITDTGNATIRKIDISNGQLSTLAGTAGMQGHKDGYGADARFTIPSGIVTGGTGSTLYIVDTGTIRKVQ